MTISQAVRLYVDQHPFLEENLAEGIVNFTGLARKMVPEISLWCDRKVTEGAIIMALKRMPSRYYPLSMGVRHFLKQLGPVTVRHEICDYTFRNSSHLLKGQEHIYRIILDHQEWFYSFSQGLRESTMVASLGLQPYITEYFGQEGLLAQKQNLAVLSITLPKENTEISGIYYFIFKKLAWQGISIIEVISTTNEISLLVSEHDVEASFSLIRQLRNV